jgi:hypothetical protein
MDGLSQDVTAKLSARTGRCTNEFYCELASENAAIEVAAGAAFVCPDCYRPLVAIKTASRGPGWKMPWLVLSGIVVVAAGVLIHAVQKHKQLPAPLVHSLPPRSQPRTEDLATSVLASAVPKTVLRTIMAPAPASLAATESPLGKAQARTTASGAAAQGSKHPHSRVSPRPRKARAWLLEGGTPSYPDTVPDVNRSVTVHVDCLIGTNGAPSGCVVTGEAAFQRAVKSWLESGKVRFAPVLRNGVPFAMRQSWDVHFEGDDSQ